MDSVVTERLAAAQVLVLDSAMGTELKRRGVPTPLPAWSSQALSADPEAILAIHRDCVRAGADLLTANTFRTTRRALGKVGAGSRAAELTAVAVRLARQAAEERVSAAEPARALVLGSMAPLEDCYRPDLVPDDSTLAREHAEHAENLARSGADALLVETMNTQREAVAAVRAGRATGLPVLASFAADARGRVFDGGSVAELVAALLDEEVAAILVNCTPVATTDRVVQELRRLTDSVPFGAYANIGFPHAAEGWEFTEDVTPTEYARHAMDWMRAGARIVGGCCGTTPDHLAAVRAAVDTGARTVTRR